VRGAQHPEWRGIGEWSSTWRWFWQFVGTQQGRAELTWSLRPLWTKEFPSLIWGELTWAVLALGLVGLGLLGRRRATLLTATLVLYSAFCWVDRLGNWYQVIMPAYPLLVLGVAAAAGRLWTAKGWGFGVRSGRALTLLRGGLMLALLALVGYRFALSHPRADCSQRPEDVGLRPGWAILADAPAPEGAVLGDHAENESLRYLTDIWGQRSDVTAVSSAQAAHLLAEGTHPVYATVGAAPLVWGEISPEVHFSSAGLALLELLGLPRTDIPEMQHAQRRDLGDGVRFLGYDLSSHGPSVALYWQACEPIRYDWSVSVRPTREGELLYGDQGLIQFDNQHPVHGLYPTSGWQLGEVVRDDYALALPPGTQADGITVVVYRPAGDGFENLGRIEVVWQP